MKPIVSIIMGSTSDLPILEKAAKFFDEMEIPFEMNALSAHRTPGEVEEFARNAKSRGIKVIIAAAGMAAHLLAIVQMPPGIPVATVGINAGQNAAILACQILASGDEEIARRLEAFKASLAQKIVKANADLKEVKFKYKTN